MQCYNGKSCPSYNDRDILFGGGWVGFCNGSNMQGEANTICWVTNESCQAFFFFKLKFFFDKKIKVFLSIKSKIIILKKNK